MQDKRLKPTSYERFMPLAGLFRYQSRICDSNLQCDSDYARNLYKISTLQALESLVIMGVSIFLRVY